MMSDADKQRISKVYQGADWRALARGSSSWHAIAGISSETGAAQEVMRLCEANDENCRVYAIGNFRVADKN